MTDIAPLYALDTALAAFDAPAGVRPLAELLVRLDLIAAPPRAGVTGLEAAVDLLESALPHSAPFLILRRTMHVWQAELPVSRPDINTQSLARSVAACAATAENAVSRVLIAAVLAANEEKARPSSKEVSRSFFGCEKN